MLLTEALTLGPLETIRWPRRQVVRNIGALSFMNQQPTNDGDADGYTSEDVLRDEIRRDDNKKRRYHLALRDHPDCSDPEHPGCVNCDLEDEELLDD